MSQKHLDAQRQETIARNREARLAQQQQVEARAQAARQQTQQGRS